MPETTGDAALLRRLPALDGIRAFAVAGVVFWHVGYLLSPGVEKLIVGGQIGVDVFFVLSGFVVTRLLIQEHTRFQRIDLRAFYVRRLERLMPALVVFVVVVVAVAAALPRFRDEVKYSLLALTYTMDFARAAAPEGVGTSRLFAHTWSLGVEMQFYLLWPLLLTSLLRRSHATALTLALSLAVASCFDGVLIVMHNAATSGRVYNGPDTRGVQLFLGCVAAIVVVRTDSEQRLIRHVSSIAAWPAVVFLVYFALRIDEQTGFHEQALTGIPARMLAIGLATAVIIVGLVLNPGHPLVRFLAWPPLANVGARYSYGLYLWHLPVIVLITAYGLGSRSARILEALLLSGLLTYFSAQFVERPFNIRKARHQQFAVQA